MALYRPSELKEFLASLGIAPKKALSQNFLIDGNIIRKIAKTAAISSNDVVLEIGPGPGSLTEELLAQGAEVIAIEKDTLLGNALARLQTGDQRLHIFLQDALEVPYESLLQPFIDKGRRVQVVANLPYNITTPILTKLLPLHHLFSNIIVMVQEEVAQRICAKPDSADMSSLTLFCQYYADVRYGFFVKKNSFFPAPSVDSAVVVFSLKSNLLEPKEEEFLFSLTRTAYQHRRKMLRGSLLPFASAEAIMEGLTKLGLSPLARPQELSLEDFIAFSRDLGDNEDHLRFRSHP
jgi:16S rRNA (adenine1518-N6/adenine1519-N6)-dimethyltransferase